MISETYRSSSFTLHDPLHDDLSEDLTGSSPDVKSDDCAHRGKAV